MFSDLRKLLRPYEGLRNISILRRWKSLWGLANERLQLLLIKDVIETNADVARAYELHDVVDVRGTGLRDESFSAQRSPSAR
jgi:hypothetical protein